MARQTALRVVKGDDDQREPEQVIAGLFAREAQLLADLAAVRAQLPEQRIRYAAKHGLTMMLPGIDRLRELFGVRP
jgi:hypothetical protein